MASSTGVPPLPQLDDFYDQMCEDLALKHSSEKLTAVDIANTLDRAAEDFGMTTPEEDESVQDEEEEEEPAGQPAKRRKTTHNQVQPSHLGGIQLFKSVAIGYDNIKKVYTITLGVQDKGFVVELTMCLYFTDETQIFLGDLTFKVLAEDTAGDATSTDFTEVTSVEDNYRWPMTMQNKNKVNHIMARDLFTSLKLASNFDNDWFQSIYGCIVNMAKKALASCGNINGLASAMEIIPLKFYHLLHGHLGKQEGQYTNSHFKATMALFFFLASSGANAVDNAVDNMNYVIGHVFGFKKGGDQDIALLETVLTINKALGFNDPPGQDKELHPMGLATKSIADKLFDEVQKPGTVINQESPVESQLTDSIQQQSGGLYALVRFVLSALSATYLKTVQQFTNTFAELKDARAQINIHNNRFDVLQRQFENIDGQLHSKLRENEEAHKQLKKLRNQPNQPDQTARIVALQRQISERTRQIIDRDRELEQLRSQFDAINEQLKTYMENERKAEDSIRTSSRARRMPTRYTQ